jgi:trehalose-phosphatase
MTTSMLGGLGRLAAVRPLLVVTDFDGTLSPIVPEPAAATILPAARRALERLVDAGSATRLAARGAASDAAPSPAVPAPPRLVVAVLSGRDAADVARRVGVAGARYLGQHGIERASLAVDDAGRLVPVAAIDPSLIARGHELERIAGNVADRLGRPEWLVVEPKGASVGLHYRRAGDTARARLDILAAVREVVSGGPPGADEAPLVMESRRVVELRPAQAFGKGEATRRLIAEVSPAATLVMGDDRTDADAFEVVRTWRKASAQPALVVGVSGASETPAELHELSDVVIPGPEAAAELLVRLADAVDALRDAGRGREAEGAGGPT